MASTASLHKNRKSTLSRIKRFLARDDHFSTSANQILMKSHNSLYDQIYSATMPVQLSVCKVKSTEEVFHIIRSKPDTELSLFIPAQVGDEFGPTWSTHLFKVNIIVPREWEAKEVHFRWNSSSEAMLLDLSGNVLQGFVCKHREFFTLSKSWGSHKDSDNVQFYVEMACNGLFGALGDGFSIDPPNNNLKYRLKLADIAVFEPLIFKLYTDLEVLLGIAEELDDTRGYQALYAANEMINLIVKSHHGDASQVASTFFSGKTDANCRSADVLFAMGHCHIDTAWLWTYNETKRKCARSWSSQIELMKEYPNIVFTCSQMQQFAWVKENYPGLFDEIKKIVLSKQFIPVGGTWVEMDGLIPNGESFIRQFLYGQKFLEKNFGMRAKEFWLPDTFGYSGQIPQILKHMGITRFLTQKISWNRVNKFPHHSFIWEGIDGSQVLAHFPPGDSYEMNGWVKEILKSVNNSEDKGRTNIGAYLYGLGDGGGGPTVPIIERLKRVQKVEGLPRIEFKGPDSFFEQLEADAHKLCKWVGELYLEMHNGTYTSQALIKLYNRKLEMMLKTVELVSTFPILTNTASSQSTDFIEDCWKGLLLNQFHDVIPGSCIELVVHDALEIYRSIYKKLCDYLLEDSKARNLYRPESKDFKDDENTHHLVALNPLPWKVKSVFQIPVTSGIKELPLAKLYQHVQLEDIPEDYQGTNISNNYVACLAELEPSGYSPVVHKDLKQLCSSLVKFSRSSDGSTGIFTNGKLRLEFSLTGRPSEKLFSKRNDKGGSISEEWEVFKDYQKSDTEPGMFYIYDDNPVCWDAWDCDDFHLETRQSIISYNGGDTGSIGLVAEGPLVGIYKWKTSPEIQSSCATQRPLHITRYTIMKADSSMLEYITIVKWAKQCHKFLKVEFPISVLSREATYEIQYGHIKRPTHSNTSWDMAQVETSGHKWADLSQYDRGVSLINNSKYGFRIKDNIIRLSLLRSPKAPDENCDMHDHIIQYGILPHAGSFQDASTIRQAYEFNADFNFFLITSKEEIDSRLLNNVITTSHEAIIPEVVKMSSNNPEKTLCIRLYESFGGTSENVTIKTRFLVKTIKECDGMEDPLATSFKIPVTTLSEELSVGKEVLTSSFATDFLPFQIKSFLLFL